MEILILEGDLENYDGYEWITNELDNCVVQERNGMIIVWFDNEWIAK